MTGPGSITRTSGPGGTGTEASETRRNPGVVRVVRETRAFSTQKLLRANFSGDAATMTEDAEKYNLSTYTRTTRTKQTDVDKYRKFFGPGSIARSGYARTITTATPRTASSRITAMAQEMSTTFYVAVKS